MHFSTIYRVPLRLPLPLLLAIGIAIGLSVSAVNAETFVEDTDYIVVSPAVKTQTTAPGKIEVREFFWYGCPHCYSLEPHIESWEKPAAVEFVRTPAVLGKSWAAHAYTYYALEALKRLEELHAVLFDAIHDKKLKLATPEQLADFFADHGLEKEKFRDAFESFVVDTRVKNSQSLVRKYKLRGVPSFVIAGKYMTSPSMTGGHRRFFKVIDYLVEKEANAL